MKRVIRLTESDLHRIVKDVLREALTEYGENPNGSGQETLGAIAGTAIAKGEDDRVSRAVRLARSKNGGPANSPAFRRAMLDAMKKNSDHFAVTVAKRFHKNQKK